MTNFDLQGEIFDIEDVLLNVAFKHAEMLLAEQDMSLLDLAKLTVNELNAEHMTRLFTSIEHYLFAKLLERFGVIQKGA